MNRLIEKILIVSASLVNLLFIIVGIILMVGIKFINENTLLLDTFVEEQNKNTTGQPLTVEEVTEVWDSIVPLASTLNYVLIGALIVSIILAIVTWLQMKKGASYKKIGLLLIVAGVFSGVVTLTAILFYIAAILFFVRKEPMDELHPHDKETLHN
ncbi:hypothetical protein [Kurthia sibirica]|uniref:DUF4064 domain-containing protein n=1 Tax=Kurthia sibirica TaxID=202750 RepID=A0A2U3AK90_9BACL|nr:hypothetical protein [Kurthia sibirica]PWI24914.1 hypothetical protein DEX24_10905 [Kurthia sibirica]GEK33176.1 hypothetical protein KSI01_07090 [Kurthia sibirica]